LAPRLFSLGFYTPWFPDALFAQDLIAQGYQAQIKGIPFALRRTRVGMSKEKSFFARVTSPEAQGISSTAVLDFCRTASRPAGIEMHSLMLVRHGNIVAEGWVGGRTQPSVNMYCFP